MAEEYLGKALSLSKEMRCGETELQCYCDLSLTKFSQEKFQEAFFYLLRSVKKCEDLRGFNAGNDQIKISLADLHYSPYKLLRGFFCAVGNPNNGLYVAELGRARALADLMKIQYSVETS